MAPRQTKRWRQTGRDTVHVCETGWSGQLKRTWRRLFAHPHQRRNGRSSGRWYHRLRCRVLADRTRWRSYSDEDWMYRATSGCERSRIVVLKIVEWSGLERKSYMCQLLETCLWLHVFVEISQMHPWKCHRNVMTKIVLTLAYARAHLKGICWHLNQSLQNVSFRSWCRRSSKTYMNWTSIWTPSFLSDICTHFT
jgi:hypothetical protein